MFVAFRMVSAKFHGVKCGMWRCSQVCFLHASRLAQAVQRCANACKLVKTGGGGMFFVRVFLYV